MLQRLATVWRLVAIFPNKLLVMRQTAYSLLLMCTVLALTNCTDDDLGIGNEEPTGGNGFQPLLQLEEGSTLGRFDGQPVYFDGEIALFADESLGTVRVSGYQRRGDDASSFAAQQFIDIPAAGNFGTSNGYGYAGGVLVIQRGQDGDYVVRLRAGERTGEVIELCGASGPCDGQHFAMHGGEHVYVAEEGRERVFYLLDAETDGTFERIGSVTLGLFADYLTDFSYGDGVLSWLEVTPTSSSSTLSVRIGLLLVGEQRTAYTRPMLMERGDVFDAWLMPVEDRIVFHRPLPSGAEFRYYELDSATLVAAYSVDGELQLVEGSRPDARLGLLANGSDGQIVGVGPRGYELLYAAGGANGAVLQGLLGFGGELLFASDIGDGGLQALTYRNRTWLPGEAFADGRSRTYASANGYLSVRAPRLVSEEGTRRLLALASDGSLWHAQGAEMPE